MTEEIITLSKTELDRTTGTINRNHRHHSKRTVYVLIIWTVLFTLDISFAEFSTLIISEVVLIMKNRFHSDITTRMDNG